MSYMLTTISLYGVSLTYEEAQRVLELAGNIGFLHEYQNEFRSLAEEFGMLDPFEMKSYYDDLKDGLDVDYPYHKFETLIDFFDYFSFPEYQVLPQHKDTIPTAYDKRRDIQFHRHRYYTDLFCCDADSRGDSLRILPERETIYGVYIASDGYAYADNLGNFQSDPRIIANYQMYCLPVLEKLGLGRPPSHQIIYQTW